MRQRLFLLTLPAVLWVMIGQLTAEEPQRIQPYEKNPFYWQYNGEPVMLLGGSQDDNIFQLPDLEEHLDEIAKAGGNYVRNTMSSRGDKGFEAYPFKRLTNGKYDLEQWNEAYWRRFENLLRWSSERDIVVQIEIWDRFDYSREHWLPHPYNPKNNVNYTYEESGFEREYPRHPGANEQPFFFTTPKQRHNQTVLQYQQRFVDKLLDYALGYPNVLYCMDNETSGQEAWAVYWADYIRGRAKEEDAPVQLTEMWDAWDLRAEQHRRTLDHPERFDFVDVSQNNHQRNETHWENFLWVRGYLGDRPRPINNVKIYGADGGRHGGDDRDAVEKMWRLIFAGAASARFHRPTSGIGLNKLAKTQLRSARMFLDQFNIFAARSDGDHRLLSGREEDEAYLSRVEGDQYAVYFTRGGEVTVRLPAAGKPCRVRWLEIDRSRWRPPLDLASEETVVLKAPGKGQWVALLEPVK